MRRGFVIHHNGPPARCVGQPHTRCEAFWRAVRRHHVVTNGWSDIAYSFGICPHGTRFVGRGWHLPQFANGRDVRGDNDGSDGLWYTVLAFVGGGAATGYDTGAAEEPVTAAMLGGIGELIDEGRRAGRCGLAVLPHNRFKHKACPGPTLTRVAAELDGRPIPPGDDMTDEDRLGLVVLTYNACLGRNPESLHVIAAGGEAIRAAGLNAYVVSVANSDEAKARRKRLADG